MDENPVERFHKVDPESPRGVVLALIVEALALADEQGLSRVGICLDQARAILMTEEGQPARGQSSD
jgi:hypothetical protein